MSRILNKTAGLITVRRGTGKTLYFRFIAVTVKTVHMEGHIVFAAIGDEAFVPTSEIKSQGVFLVQSLQSGDLTHEWGVRLENQDIDPLAQAAVSHDVISLSYSSLWDLSDTTTLTMALSRSQRAPAVEELFANGLHVATDTFEIGSRDLTEETANSIELSVRRQLAATTATFNVFYNHIEDYIFQRARGDLFNETTDALVGICPPGNECAAVFVFSQQDASFRGFEAELAWTAFDTAQYPVKVRIFSDYVRATLDNGGDVPRLPPAALWF